MTGKSYLLSYVTLTADINIAHKNYILDINYATTIILQI